MRTITALKAAGKTHPGRHRSVNEDRLHVDPVRGVFIVVDGVGGQAAGGRAADVALGMIKARLERETGPVPNRIREALTIANNEVYRLAATRPEWQGMACVATVLVVDGARAFVGHVGDTRLYKLSSAGIAKLTHDHSPVGEREDAGELSELDAMRHARRNEVYRDLGSDLHEPGDPDFIEASEVPFEPESALMLCSDGLTDLVPSGTIEDVVRQFAGEPDRVAGALVDAANHAGGKDNVTVVYVEGDRFAARPVRPRAPVAETRPFGVHGSSRSERVVRVAILVLLTMVLALSVGRLPGTALLDQAATLAPAIGAGELVVREGESISAALERAPAGTQVVVEPGEYREAVSLVSGVRLISRVPAGAVLRLPATAGEADAAAVAIGISGASIAGFRIVGDATTALGTGLLVRDAQVQIVDMDVSGATRVAIDVGGTSHVELMASKLHDNPGAALAVRAGASARVTHNVFARNGGVPHAVSPFIVGEETALTFAANMFPDLAPTAFHMLTEPTRTELTRDNWFGGARTTPPARPRGSPNPSSGRPQPRQAGPR